MSFRALLTQPLLREQSRLERRSLSLDPRPRAEAVRKTETGWTAFLPSAPPLERSLDLSDAHQEIFQLESAGYKVADPEFDLDDDGSVPELARCGQAEQVLRAAFGAPAESGPVNLTQSLGRIAEAGAPGGVRLRSLSLLGS